MIDVLVIAVIGGLYRLEGAWLGAFVFVMLNNYSRQIDFVGPRFHTLIGLVFLAIVLVSPAGLAGIWERVQATLGSEAALGPQPATAAEAPTGDADG